MNNNQKKIDGVMRCVTCGEEKPRVARGLNYGYPQHCGQRMRVVTPLELEQEREYQDTLEHEESFMASTEIGGTL